MLAHANWLTFGSYCSRAQSERLENLQSRSLSLQTDQANTLNRICDGLRDVQARLILGQKPEDTQDNGNRLNVGDVQFLREKLQQLSLSEDNVQKQQAILESLTFNSRPERHAQIAEAHKETFKWVLMTTNDPTLEPSIGDWLQQGEGIFWVSGKPGSGKSTFMKYIADSPMTRRLVTKWAQPCKAIIISHYFWIAGTSLQKSQQGLLQTLLYDIFRQCPDLINTTCVERWKACENMCTISESIRPWSLEELHYTLKACVARDDACLKLCFIIDGLDEYSGNHEDQTRLCQTLKHLATSANVKLCLSSRPWNIFVEEFGLEFPKVYMQDLTRDDIHNYALSRLQEHTRWSAVSASQSQGQWLISEITAKSNGVFLWVFLVTKLLREGLTNRDTFADLRRRLSSFPSELEQFFKSILEAVEPFYHSQMSTALQIANASLEGQLSLLIYSFHFQEYEDVDYAINLPIGVMKEGEVERIKSDTSWHLESRTRGLLEVNSKEGNVTFLHRTVRDFLNTQEMHDYLIAKADSRLNFYPALSILKSCVSMIKTSSVPGRTTRTEFGSFHTAMNSSSDHRQHILQRLVSQALIYAGQIEFHETHDPRYIALLDELDRTLLFLYSGGAYTLVPSSWMVMRQAFFREQVVKLGLFDYLASKLNSDPAFLRNIGTLPVLRFISSRAARDSEPRRGYLERNLEDLYRGHSRWTQSGFTGPELRPNQGQEMESRRRKSINALVNILDKRGIDPNKADELADISAWRELLLYICRCWTTDRETATSTLSLLLEERILSLFLKAGADTHAQIAGSSSKLINSRNRAATIVFVEFCFDILSKSPPIQALYLDVLVEFLHRTRTWLLKDTINQFCTTLRNRDRDELRWESPFLAEVKTRLHVSLATRGPGNAEDLQQLEWTAKLVFPSNLVTPMAIGTVQARRQRKQESESGRQRKSHRMT